jgi:Uncharacterized protein conserved in bacteria C-term(DUF2220)/Uncharacterized protein conserved in bacteria N-term (DUF3322)
MSFETGTALLNRLLDAMERRPERTKPVRLALPVLVGEESRREMLRAIDAAAAAGAVKTITGRGETAHVIGAVRLADVAALYAHLGRRPAGEVANEVIERARASVGSDVADIELLLGKIRLAWARRRASYGLRPGDEEGATDFFTVVKAYLLRDPDDRTDLRTFSIRATGRSKLVERNRGRLIAFLRDTGRLDADLTFRDAVLAAGLEKQAHPVLLAGPLLVGGADVTALTYVGIAPDDVESLERARPLRLVLSVENLASFNRQVRECRQHDVAVVFTGGFPSRTVKSTLRRLSKLSTDGIAHWGDLDPHGLMIAREVAGCTDRFQLHLMDLNLARSLGHHATPTKHRRRSGDPPQVGEVLEFLGTQCARHLEQEAVDPKPV